MGGDQELGDVTSHKEIMNAVSAMDLHNMGINDQASSIQGLEETFMPSTKAQVPLEVRHENFGAGESFPGQFGADKRRKSSISPTKFKSALGRTDEDRLENEVRELNIIM